MDRELDRPRLETNRLVLRPLALDDLDEMASLLDDGEVLVLRGEPLDRDGARAWIQRNRAHARHVPAAEIVAEESFGLLSTPDLVTERFGWLVGSG